VAVTALPERGVLGPAAGVMLDRNARPMIERLAQPRIAGEPSGHDPAFAGALGHRGGATKRPQSVVVSALQGLPAFCEQRGKDDPAVSWQFPTGPTADPQWMKLC
jgi:hypothetical protein